MGTRVDKLKDGKFRFFHSCTDTESNGLTRIEALLYIRNTCTPYDFIREYYAFPCRWTDDEGEDKYRLWLKSVKTDQEVWDKYLAVIKELEES